MSKSIKEILHSKREEADAHIRQLEEAGKQGIRYTAMMPDMRFFILALLCDVGWIVHLITGIVYCAKNGFTYAVDWLALVALAGIVTGVGFTIHLNMIHEKEIATRFQKNLSFGLTAFSGLAGAMIAAFQMALYAGISAPLLLIAAGGILNFAAGFPIYLSFKKGIKYGVH